MVERINKCSLFLSTMGPIGYLRAPGTMATLATLAFLLCAKIPSQYYLFFLVLNTALAFFCIKRSLHFFVVKDPSEIVIDEYIGCLVTFYFLPVHSASLIGGFMLFRFFDIVKCFGIKSCENIGGAWGIMLDDILAGIFANCCLHLILLVFSL